MRKKLLLVLSLTSIFSCTLQAQDLRERLDMDPGSICRDMVRLPGGSSVAVGEVSGAPLPFGWVSMLSASGDVIWTKIPFDQNRASQYLKVVADTDSTFLVGGTQFIDPVQGTNLLLFRMDVKGQVLWSRTVHVNQVDGFSDMDLFEKGVVMVGTTLDAATGLDVIVAVFDTQGNPGVFRQFGAAGLETAKSIQYAGPKGFYVAGTTTSYTFPGSQPSAFLMQISPAFSLSWMRLIGDQDEQRVESMDLDQVGNPLVAIHDAGGLGANFICNFNSAGSLLWAKSYNTSYLRAMTRANGGKIYAADDHKVFGMDIDGNVTTAWMLQTDPDFITSGLTIGPKGQYMLYGWNAQTQDYPALHMIPDPFTSNCDVGTTIVAGQPYTPNVINELINEKDGGIVAGFPMPMIYIDVTRIIDCQTTGVEPTTIADATLIAQPNPTRGQVQLHIPTQGRGLLTWYHVDGTLMARNWIEVTDVPVQQDLSSWSPGTYLVDFRSGDRQWSTTVIRTE
ncbi:MAG: hypothetical protein K9I85_04390 [Saprospiraceae bacterium]|nr:hypothetical protein [Saprospiraceae bacterium]